MSEPVEIMHTADTHLGARPLGMREREEELYATFEALVDSVLEARPRALLIAGDLFDVPRPEPPVIRFALTQIKRLTEKGIEVIAAHGEHDTPGRPQATVLQLLESALAPRFKAPLSLGVGSIEELARSTLLELGDLSVIVYPFRRAPLETRKTIAEGLLQAYKNITPRLAGARVFLGHFSLKEALPWDHLAYARDLPPVEYAAMGHVHVRKIDPGGEQWPAYTYPGSLEPLNRDEAKHNHVRGPLRVTLRRGEPPSVEEVKLPTRPHVNVETRIGGPLDLAPSISRALAEAERRAGESLLPPLVLLTVRVAGGLSPRAVEAEAHRQARARGILVRLYVEREEEVVEQKPGAAALASPLDLMVSELGLSRGAAELVLEVQRAVLEGDVNSITSLLERLAREHPEVVRRFSA